MDYLHLEVLSLDGQIVKADNVYVVILETLTGPIEIYRNHINLLTDLDIGILTYKEFEGETHRIAIGANGFSEIHDNRVTVYVSTAEVSEDIDVARARKAKENALALLEGQKSHNFDVLRAEIALKKALARLEISEDM